MRKIGLGLSTVVVVVTIVVFALYFGEFLRRIVVITIGGNLDMDTFWGGYWMLTYANALSPRLGLSILLAIFYFGLGFLVEKKIK